MNDCKDEERDTVTNAANGEERVICDGKHIHPDKKSGGFTMPSDKDLASMAELFKVFGDETRMKIMSLLLKREMCVCDIADFVGMSQSAVSHQLGVLKKARLVKFRREGKTILYSLDDEHVRDIFVEAQDHVRE